MKEMHRARCEERARSFHVLSGPPLSTNFHEYINMEALQTPSFLGFLWRLHCKVLVDEFIGHWCLNSTSSPSSLSRGSGVELKVPTL